MPAQQQAVDVACNLSDQRDYKFTDYHMTKIFYFFLLFLIISCDTNLDNKRQENLPEPKQVVIKRYYLKKKNYKLEYLFTWTIDSSDKKMDPDNSVTINSPHDGSISFMTFNKPLDEREQIQQLINEDLNNSMKNGQVSALLNGVATSDREQKLLASFKVNMTPKLAFLPIRVTLVLLYAFLIFLTQTKLKTTKDSNSLKTLLSFDNKLQPTSGLLLCWRDVVAISNKPLISSGRRATFSKLSLV